MNDLSTYTSPLQIPFSSPSIPHLPPPTYCGIPGTIQPSYQITYASPIQPIYTWQQCALECIGECVSFAFRVMGDETLGPSCALFGLPT